MELFFDKPLEFVESSVWAVGSKYYIDGKAESISIETILETDPDLIRKGLEQYRDCNSYEHFESFASKFVQANAEHLEAIVSEACRFISSSAQGYDEENLVVSFSGGKDSTVTADLAARALSSPYLVHIFGDTTLEFPSTLEYAKRFRESHPLAIFKTARNDDQVFLDMAEEIGPPARLMRWCCSTFKTGPITRVFNSLYGNQSVLTFQGVRKAESAARSKYNRIEDDAESVKIQKQRVALPIFFWTDLDVWLYILSEGIDFNEAYRLGYERVGCWCCPNNNERAEFLSKVYMPDRMNIWNDFLLRFAKKVGKPDPEEYISSGNWKARQGGNSLSAASSVKIEASRCATEDNAMVFSLCRPYTNDLANLFSPIGAYIPGLGRSLLDERVFVDPVSKEPLVAVMPFRDSSYEYAAKVRVLKTSEADVILRIAKYQILKYNACRQCLKCESLCLYGAISATSEGYKINERKCIHCRQCVTDKFLEGGCLMGKYLRTKE